MRLPVPLWIAVAVIVVFGFVGGLGYDERSRQDGEMGLLGRLLVGADPVEVCNTLHPIVLSVAEDTMAKAQVSGHNLSYSFTFKHAIWPGMDALNLYVFGPFTVSGAGIDIEFTAITDMANHPGEIGFAVAVMTPDPDDPFLPETTFWYTVPESEEEIYWIEIPCSVTLGGLSAIDLTAADDPIGDKSAATHAKERTATDSWFLPAGTAVTVSVGGETDAVSIVADMETGMGIGIIGWGIDADDWSDYMVGVKYAMSIENIAFGPVTIDTSGYTARTWGNTAASVNKLWVEGFGGDSIGFWCSEGFYNGAYVYNQYDGGIISAPLNHSFTGLAVMRMGTGELLGDLEVWFTGAQIYDAVEAAWSYLKKTVSEWRSTTLVPNWGGYFWDADPPPDGALRCLPAATFYIDKDSAQDHGLEGFQVASTAWHSFDDDSCVVIHGWPLDATDRTSDPHFNDVVTITHEDNVGVFGPSPALDNTDWSPGAGCTQTDADGNFTVTNTTGATQTLAIPSNYTSRLQTEVPAQTAPEGIPSAYNTRRADWYLSGGEDPEGVYCWMGWRYLRVPLTVPTACNVIATITYQGLGTHSDNHYSDSSRQTEYEYTPGATHTLTRTVAMSAGAAQPMLIDLASDTPLAVVTSIELSLGAVGAWRVGEPELVLDPGDGEREAVTPHWWWKFFEHYGYAEGGFSAVVDGQRCAVEWPDHYKPNTRETHIGGNFNYVEGKVSGIDLTAADPLSTTVSNIERCANAWDTSFNTTAADAHLKDDEGEVLKVLSVTDLRPVDGTDAEVASPDIAIRVGKWTCAAGLHYNWYAEKWVRGVGHGWVGSSSTPTRGGTGELYRRDDGETIAWTLVENITGNQHGYWKSNGHEIVYEYDADDAEYYKYATSSTGSGGMGHFATREWVSGNISVSVQVYGRFTLVALHPTRRILHFYQTDSGIEHIYSNDEIQYWANSALVDAGYTNPHLDTDDASDANPSAMYTSTGRTILCWVRDGSAYMKYSDDTGETWSEADEVLPGYDYAFFWMDGNTASPIINCALIDSEGEVFYTYSVNGGTTFFPVVSVTTGADAGQPSGFTTINGRRCILYGKDDEEALSYSDDGGITWTEV